MEYLYFKSMLFRKLFNSKNRGVETGGGRVGRYAPPASENFVFFERQNRKKYFFSGV